MPDANRPYPQSPQAGEAAAAKLLRPEGERYEAVDRLMAMATARRADRAPAPPDAEVLGPLAAAPSPVPQASAGQVFGQVARGAFTRLRPMLPALAGALRLVDHGAVQAAARLLPLLAGSAAPSAEDPTPRALAALEAGGREQEKTIQKLRDQVASTDEQVGALRVRTEELAAEQAVLAQQWREQSQELAGRVRLLTYAVIVLLPLVLAMVVLLFLHLR